jgi:hypothetical protein
MASTPSINTNHFMSVGNEQWDTTPESCPDISTFAKRKRESSPTSTKAIKKPRDSTGGAPKPTQSFSALLKPTQPELEALGCKSPTKHSLFLDLQVNVVRFNELGECLHDV